MYHHLFVYKCTLLLFERGFATNVPSCLWHFRMSDSNPRRFRFAIRCCCCYLPFYTTHTAREHFEHFVYACPRRARPMIRCGCCGTLYRNWGRCASHLNVCGAHLRGPAATITVSSTTSSSEAESTSHEPSRRTHAATQPPQIKTETEAATTSHAAIDAPPLATPPVPAASASVSPLSFSASDTSLTHGLDLSTDNPILQQIVPFQLRARKQGKVCLLQLSSLLLPPSLLHSKLGQLRVGARIFGDSDIILSPAMRCSGYKRPQRRRTSLLSRRPRISLLAVCRCFRTGPQLLTLCNRCSRSPLRLFRIIRSTRTRV